MSTPEPAGEPTAKPSNTMMMPASLRVRPGIAKPKPKARAPAPAAAAATATGTPLEGSTEDAAEPRQRKAAGAEAPKPRLPIGEVRHVDCYARLNLIAESQHGIVYRARNKATGAIVALKKFKTRKEPDGFPITFLREINILFTIKHPNIITADEMVFGGAEEDLAWFLVME